MKMKLVLTPDGKVLISVPEGTFEAARATIERALKELGLDGMPLVLETAIEQHKHDTADVNVHRHAHDHN